MPPLISTSHLTKVYRRGPQEIRALDGVNLSVKAGQFVCVVGSSGSGKSTLLNLLAGLDTPSEGTIEVDGIGLDSMSRRELSAYRAAQIGMVFQSFNLIQHLSALRNVETALLFSRIERRDRSTAASESLIRLGLSDRADHLPGDLSGGEQQRVALARALVKQPRILLADEPTGNLDHQNSENIAELLKQLNREGLTIIMVTHNLGLAQQCADSIIKMDFGRIVEDGEGMTA